jgi:hypothetical protein
MTVQDLLAVDGRNATEDSHETSGPESAWRKSEYLFL